MTGVGYMALVRVFPISETPLDQQFGATGTGEALVRISVQPISIDALNSVMQVRVTLAPGAALRGELVSAPHQDLLLVISHGQTAHETKIPANEPASPTTIEVDLKGGDVADYPFDSYRTDLRVQCFEKVPPPAGEAKRLPAQVNVWEAVLGFHLHAAEQPGSSPDQVRLSLEVHRGGAFTLFALAAYGAMAVLGCCALTIGILAFTGVRRPDPPLIGALGAIVFALPALRIELPGAPPLGVRADMFVFLWTVLAAVIALGLLVSTWARAGPRP